MKSSRGKSIAIGLALGAAGFLALAAYAGRHRILEVWHLHRLEGEDPAARLGAIETLGRIGSVRAVPRLCLLLDSTSREERAAAASALGAIGPEAAEAARPLVRLFLGEPMDRAVFVREPENDLTPVARATRRALARIGPAAIPAVFEASLGARQPPGALLLLVAFDEGLLPLADVMRSGATRIRTRSCLGPYGAWYSGAGEPPTTGFEYLIRNADNALAEDPGEVSRLIPLLNRWRAGADAGGLPQNLPHPLLSSDPALALRLARDADVRIARELRLTCLNALSQPGAGAASALPFLLDCFDDRETRSLAGDALGQSGAAAVEHLLPHLLRGTGSARFHAEFALIGAGTADLNAARAIVRALPGAEGEGWTRLTRGVLGRIGENAWKALDEALEGDDMALRRAARAALLSLRRG